MEKDNKNEVSIVEDKDLKTLTPGAEVTPMLMLERAYDQNADVATLERLFELKTKVDADEARKAFHIAMAEFKKNPPKVLKDKINSQYGSKYAGIGNLVNTVSACLGEHGITHSFNQDSQANPMSVTCMLTHEKGHSESTVMYGPIDDSGAKNDLQKIKSTMTYLRSATFESITGIIASDDGDNDGNESVSFITNEQVETLRKLIEDSGADIPQFLEFVGAKSLAEIPMAHYGKAEATLKRKLKEKNK